MARSGPSDPQSSRERILPSADNNWADLIRSSRAERLVGRPSLCMTSTPGRLGGRARARWRGSGNPHVGVARLKLSATDAQMGQG